MQEQTVPTVAKPMTAFHDALSRLGFAHEDLLAAERALEQRVREAKRAYAEAYGRADEIEEGCPTFPSQFFFPGVLVLFDEEGEITLERRAITEPYELLTWARKAGEEQ